MLSLIIWPVPNVKAKGWLLKWKKKEEEEQKKMMHQIRWDPGLNEEIKETDPIGHPGALALWKEKTHKKKEKSGSHPVLIFSLNDDLTFQSCNYKLTSGRGNKSNNHDPTRYG